MRVARPLILTIPLLLSAPSLAQVASEWPAWQGGNGHWYAGIPTSRTWADARVHAASLGAHLATVTSAAENAFVNSVRAASGLDRPWLGGFQDLAAPDHSEPAGGWRWVTGEPWSFTAWAGGEPNNQGNEHWLHYGSNSGFWNDLPSWSQWPALIEWSADCDEDGLVDYGQIIAGDREDTDADGIPDCCELGGGCEPCRSDVDGDGTVQAEDLAAVLFAWGMPGGRAGAADVDRDGDVDGSDLAAILGEWGPCSN